MFTILQSLVIAAPIIYLAVGISALCRADWQVKGEPLWWEYLAPMGFMLFILPAGLITAVFMSAGTVVLQARPRRDD